MFWTEEQPFHNLIDIMLCSNKVMDVQVRLRDLHFGDLPVRYLLRAPCIKHVQVCAITGTVEYIIGVYSSMKQY